MQKESWLKRTFSIREDARNGQIAKWTVVVSIIALVVSIIAIVVH